MDSLCRILKNGSEDTAGSGFLIGPKRMITCAHVLDEVFKGQGVKLSKGLEIDNILCGDHKLEGQVFDIELIRDSVENSPQDIAVIDLKEKKGAPAFRIPPSHLDGYSINHNLTGESCWIGHNVNRKKWTVTECRKIVDKGRYELSVISNMIPAGASGGPIVAKIEGNDCIVGMVSARSHSDETAFMIPRSHFEQYINPEEVCIDSTVSGATDRNHLLIRLLDRTEQYEATDVSDYPAGEFCTEGNLRFYVVKAKADDMPGHFGEKLLVQPVLNELSTRERDASDGFFLSGFVADESPKGLVRKLNDLIADISNRNNTYVAVLLKCEPKAVLSFVKTIKDKFASRYPQICIRVIVAVKYTESKPNLLQRMKLSKVEKYEDWVLTVESDDVVVLPPFKNITNDDLTYWLSSWPVQFKRMYLYDQLQSEVQQLFVSKTSLTLRELVGELDKKLTALTVT